jgi:hypothetical protein
MGLFLAAVESEDLACLRPPPEVLIVRAAKIEMICIDVSELL